MCTIKVLPVLLLTQLAHNSKALKFLMTRDRKEERKKTQARVVFHISYRLEDTLKICTAVTSFAGNMCVTVDRHFPTGAFLVPYLFMLLVLGIPLLHMELTVGQYTRRGPVHALANVLSLIHI